MAKRCNGCGDPYKGFGSMCPACRKKPATKSDANGGDNLAADCCEVCRKRVYAMEQLSIEGKLFHKDCFKCITCSRKLAGGDFARNELGFFCIPHFQQIAQVTGGYKSGSAATASLVDSMIKRDMAVGFSSNSQTGMTQSDVVANFNANCAAASAVAAAAADALPSAVSQASSRPGAAPNASGGAPDGAALTSDDRVEVAVVAAGGAAEASVAEVVEPLPEEPAEAPEQVADVPVPLQEPPAPPVAASTEELETGEKELPAPPAVASTEEVAEEGTAAAADDEQAEPADGDKEEDEEDSGDDGFVEDERRKDLPCEQGVLDVGHW